MIAFLPYLARAQRTDCNLNGIQDGLDIAAGTSLDCDLNGIPDECQVGTVLYFLNFDSSAGGSMTGLWHWTGSCRPAGDCGEGWYAYYGQDQTCDFDTGLSTSGSLILPAISVPPESSLKLSFCSYYDSDDFIADQAEVYIYEVGGGLLLYEPVNMGPSEVWLPWSLDVPDAAGKNVTVVFWFYTDDDLFNDYYGWGVDNIELYAKTNDQDCNENGIPDACDPDLNSNGIPDDCECLLSNYCISTPNSTGHAGVIGASGIPSISLNSFNLRAGYLPPHDFGLFFFGSAERDPFAHGSGYICIAPQGMMRLNPPLQSNAAGTVVRLFDLATGPGAMINPGETRYFQYWYRDHPPAGATWNFTDGLEVTFCP